MFTRWILLFTLAISSWLLARASFVETAMNNFVEEFTKSCPSDGIPVCGSRGREYFLFPNECWLNDVNAEGLFGLFENIKKVPIKFCFNDCSLMCPQVYEPVCALNVKTQERTLFRNMCEATEYACRTNMDFQQLHQTACEQPKKLPQVSKMMQLTEVLPNSKKALGKRSRKSKYVPIPCTGVFRPVCGIYKGVKSTFKNECLLNAENVKFEKDWRVIKYGVCDEDYSNVRRNPNNRPSNGHSIRKRSYANSLNYMHFQKRARHSMDNYKPHTDMSHDDLFSYMPNLFQNHFEQRDLSNAPSKEQVTNSIIQKIISLPSPNLYATSQEQIMDEEMGAGEQFAASNVKPMQYRENNMKFNYNSIDSKISNDNLQPSASQVLKRNENIPLVSQAFDFTTRSKAIENIPPQSASGILKRNEMFPSAYQDYDIIRSRANENVPQVSKRKEILPSTSRAFDYIASRANEIFPHSSSQVLKNNEILPSASQDYDIIGGRANENHPPTMSLALKKNEILPSASEDYDIIGGRAKENRPPTNGNPASSSQAMDINSYAENSVDNEANYYYQTSEVSSTSASEPKGVEPVPETTTTAPAATSTTSRVDHIFIISLRTTPKYVSPKKIIEKTSTNSSVCKFGKEPICGRLSNGTVMTFETICDMMTRNSFLKSTWVKLHSGTCETCKNNCSREYNPVCVQRNGVNYTMVNDCYYNMGICLDKRSKWRKITNGECKRYIRIPDKYENMKPGFPFTSKYLVTSTTQAIPTATPITTTSTAFRTKTTIEATPTKVKPTEATPTESVITQTNRRSRKRNSSFSRKLSRHSRPSITSKHLGTLDTYIMNLTNRRKRLTHSTTLIDAHKMLQ